MNHRRIIFTFGRTATYHMLSQLNAHFTCKKIGNGEIVPYLRDDSKLPKHGETLAYNDNRLVYLELSPRELVHADKCLLVVPTKAGKDCRKTIELYLKPGTVAIGFGIFGPYRDNPGCIACPSRVIAMQGLPDLGAKAVSGAHDTFYTTSHLFESKLRDIAKKHAMITEGNIATIFSADKDFAWIDKYSRDASFVGQDKESAYLLHIAKVNRAKTIGSLLVATDMPLQPNIENRNLTMNLVNKSDKIEKFHKYLPRKEGIETLQSISKALVSFMLT